MPDLMWLFLLPLIFAGLIFILPFFKRRPLKYLAVLMSLVPLALLLYKHDIWISSEVKYAWMPNLDINFHLKVDELSLIFLYLSAIVIPVSILAVKSGTLNFPNAFYGSILFLQSLLIGFFTSRDLVLFTLFFEAMLLPLYFIITFWGKEKRQAAALQFLTYMIAGSTLMIAGILGLYMTAGSFDLEALKNSSVPYAGWLFAIFMLAFAVKTPLFPFHAWLPDAYTQAPTSGSILLAGLLSKAGIYGIFRIGMEIFPDLLRQWSPLLLWLAIAGVFYGGLAAWRQMDYKRLIAYSSFSHVNFILVGLFALNAVSYEGALIQSLNHGITITALFLASGWLEERIETTKMYFGGLAKYLPWLCWLTLIFVLATVAVPGTNNFVGELLILFGLFIRDKWLAALLGLSIILSAIYMLRLMQKVYFQSPSPIPETKLLVDLKPKEIALGMLLALLIFWIGIYPAPILRQMVVPAAEKVFLSKDRISEY